MNPFKERLIQLLNITDKEAQHLIGVDRRLLKILSDHQQQFSEYLDQPILIDTLESFSAKFSRMQDTIADKLLPVFLNAAGEETGTVIENLNRAERLHLINNTQNWIIARGLRNKLVHEYIENPQDLLEAIDLAHEFIKELVHTQKEIKDYTHNKLKIK